ncbi:MAG TPA: FAD-dependent monooxygenase [Pseudonocardiaceae bacterium]
MSDRWDVAIVGAGPAGCAAALGALRARPDARVLLIDAAAFPRDKVCGDGIAPHALDVLTELGVDHDELVEGCAPITRLRLCAPGGSIASRPMTRTGFVVPRAVFDERLVRAAVAAGAVLRRHTVRRLRVGHDEVELDDGSVASVVIGADGAESVVRRAALAQSPEPGTIAPARSRGSHTMGSAGSPEPGTIALAGSPGSGTTASARPPRSDATASAGSPGSGTIVGSGAATSAQPPRSGTMALAIRGYAPADPWPAGEQLLRMTATNWPAYAWVFPIGDGRANVGYGEILRDTPLTRAHLEQRLRDLLPDARPTQLRAHRLPLSTGRLPVGHGRVLLAGDAAALINPLTGEGIFYAVASGALAGAAAVGPDPATTYARTFRARLGRHLRHTDVAAALTRTPKMINAAVAASARDQHTFDAFVDLGLGDGLLTARGLLRTARHLF